MQSKKQFRNLISRTISRVAKIALATATVFALTVVLTQSAQAQIFKVIHAFSGGGDGGSPWAGLTIDKAGNLYGTASVGGADGDGTVYRLQYKGSGWVFTPLYSFRGSPDDGAYPSAAVVFGPGGSLYGTTAQGGVQECGNGSSPCGTVFNLKPAAIACKTALCPWTETVLYYPDGGEGGAFPAGLTFDPAGNMYYTASVSHQGGVVKLAPSNGGWQFNLSCNVSSSIPSGVILDAAGNLYGGGGGGGGNGFVFQLNMSGGVCTENILYSFQGGIDGADPSGGLIFDDSGNLYGSTAVGGLRVGGTAFELSPSNGNWTFRLLYSFAGTEGPTASLTMDAAGNLYGTTFKDGAYGAGTVFKLTPSGGSWQYTSLHDFTGGSDGRWPASNVTFDANGNLYGTAPGGGSQNCYQGCGVVWEITP